VIILNNPVHPGKTGSGGYKMEQMQIGSSIYYVNRIYAGVKHPKDLILEKIISVKPFEPLDKTPKSEL